MSFPFMQTIDYLNGFDMFKGLYQTELKEIAKHSAVKIYAKDTTLFYQLEPITHIFFLVEGQIRIYTLTEEGNEVTVDYATNGNALPHIGFFTTKHYPSYAETLKTCTVILTPITFFKEAMMKYPLICENIASLMEKQIIELRTRLEEKVSLSIPDQILTLLLRISQMLGTERDDGWQMIHIHLSHRDLANMIGLTRETINRYFSKLKRHQAIDYTTEGYLLIHPATVAALLHNQKLVH